jgi:hypothetical protein
VGSPSKSALTSPSESAIALNVATTMGFTGLEGLIMGTRSGALLYLIDTHGMDARAIEDLLYHQSGLLAVSDLSSDMHTLRASLAPEAAEAIALIVYRVIREIGSLAAAMAALTAWLSPPAASARTTRPHPRRGGKPLCLARPDLGRGAQCTGRRLDQRGRVPRRRLGGANRRGTHDRPPHRQPAGPAPERACLKLRGP